MKKISMKSSKNIWMMSILIFAAVATSMLFSTYYMNKSIQAEEEAQTKRAEYKQLSENLANASDYLTEEVRYYAVTGDVEHLFNYWDEIFSTKQREDAIETFESDNPPEDEKKLLEQAKNYSDLLVETEIYSMKLVLVSMGKTAADYEEGSSLQQYVSHVLSFENTNEMQNMTTEEMRQKAIDILYDRNYENYKIEIMTPIDDFKVIMNTRLDKEVEERKQGTRIATVIQIIMAVAELVAIGFVLNLMKHLYIQPLNRYTKEIYASEDEIDESRKIVSDGALELIRFAEAFNQMIDRFLEELRHRKNAEESMRTAMQEAKLANEAKSIFLAQMSHELRTPLNAVNGYIYLLNQTSMTGKQEKYTKSIRYSANGLLELINQILDFSKIEAGKLELECLDFNIYELVNEVNAMFIQQVKQKNLYLNVKMDENIPHIIKGDPLRMRQILINLIGNALKFTEQGGITVELKKVKQRQDFCLLYVAISDTGIGIAESAKEKIFHAFTQSDASTTRKYGGTGLGLPICREIISMEGDKTHKLELKSQLGKGSKFYFNMDFPISNKSEEELKVKTIAIPDCSGKKILITDDSAINIRVQSEILGLCGIKVVAAESGKATLQILKLQKDIDMILMDIRMPEMDGYETARQIRKTERYQCIPIVALTADAVPEVREKVAKAGMDDCLLKPIQQDQLFKALLKYLKVDKFNNSVEVMAANTWEDEQYFDEEACAQQLGGKKEALGNIIHCFLIIHSRDDEKLKNYLRKKDYKQAEDLVHQLKGIIGNINCRPLYTCLKNFQEELKRKEDSSSFEFLELWKKTLPYLEEYNRKYEEMLALKIIHSKVIDLSEKNNLCEQIIELSGNYDTEAILILEEEKEKLEAYCDKSTYYILCEAVIKFDFPLITKVTSQIMKTEKANHMEVSECTR